MQVFLVDVAGKVVFVVDIELLAQLGYSLSHPLVLAVGQPQHPQQQLVMILSKQRQVVSLSAVVGVLVVGEVQQFKAGECRVESKRVISVHTAQQ